MIRPRYSGGTTVMMHMGTVNTVARHPREAVVVMPGRVMGLLRDRFLALRVDLSREPPAQITGKEVATVVTVAVGVVVVGGTADSLRHRQLLTMRRQQWRPIPRSSLPRRWRW